MCSAVEVAWLAQNIRHSSTRVWVHLQRHLVVSSMNGVWKLLKTVIFEAFLVGNSQNDSAAETRFGLNTMLSRIRFDSKFIANDSNIIRLEDSCQVDHGNASRSKEIPVTRSLKTHAGVCLPTLRSQPCILILPTLWNIRRAASA